jgi:DNA helicase-2/ATP-dependent DNA helicase PcrA
MGDPGKIGIVAAAPAAPNARDALRAAINDRLRPTPSRDRLTDEQVEFIAHSLSKPSLLHACPGSGKTEVTGFKLAFEKASWAHPTSGIAILTFTRTAAAEIRNRVIQHSHSGTSVYPHFVGTIDSWLHGYIVQPFAYSVMDFKGRDGDHSIRLVEALSHPSPFLSRFQSAFFRGQAPEIHQVFDYYLGPDGLPYDSPGKLVTTDPKKQEVLIAKKKQFAASGFATYDDAVSWAMKLLNSKANLAKLVVKRFPYIIIDECQDLSPNQLDLLEVLRQNGATCHFVGDLNQAIYGFREVDPSKVEAFCKTGGAIPLELSANFRSVQPIADFAANFVNGKKMKARTPGTEPHCILWTFDEKSAVAKPLLPLHFEELLRMRGIDASKCAVIARGERTLDRIRQQRTDAEGLAAEVALALWLWHNTKGRSTLAMTEAMERFGKVFCRTAYDGAGQATRQYCPGGISAIEWRLTLSQILDEGQKISSFMDGATPFKWSNWVKQELKPWLSTIWPKLPLASSKWEDSEKRFKAPDKMGDSSMLDIFTNNHDSAHTRITTIHSVKGESLDAVLLVSARDRKSKGGHVEQRLDDPKSENARFAYVAMTRARNLLVIAVPQGDGRSIARLKDFGAQEQIKPDLS